MINTCRVISQIQTEELKAENRKKSLMLSCVLNLQVLMSDKGPDSSVKI